jgi:N-acetylneuraminate synthase/N,N'-diacetyllegionaminate synthase
MKSFRIGQHLIAADKPVLVIAEIGVNHDGSAGRALDLVQFAKRGGADAVKLQIFSADRLMHATTKLADYQKQRVDDASAAGMLKRYELAAADVERIVRAIRTSNMVPIATPFSIEDVETVERLDLPAIKIASPDLVNRPLLEAVAKTKRSMLVSTGAATIEEVESAVRWLSESPAKFALLHCVSSYPTTLEDANLCWIDELSKKFDVPVGYSDHTTDALAGAFAVSAGAMMVEKHLTYDRAASGPDHAASANPAEFQKYVASIRLAEMMRGTPGKQVLDCERDVRRISRQSVVAVRDIVAGSQIDPADLTIQRPGTGVPAGEFMRVVGRKSRRAIAAGTLLQGDMLEAA